MFLSGKMIPGMRLYIQEWYGDIFQYLTPVISQVLNIECISNSLITEGLLPFDMGTTPCIMPTFADILTRLVIHKHLQQ